MANDTGIEEAIKELTVKGSSGATADEALKYTQAALNLAHTQSVLDQNKRNEINK